MIRLKLRFDFPDGTGLGRGKIELLEEIGRIGSIAAAGRALGMSYRRAWLLIDSLNRVFAKPVVETAHGGTRGGGAELTKFGREIVRRFRRMETAAGSAVARDLKAIGASYAGGATRPKRTARGGRKRRI